MCTWNLTHTLSLSRFPLCLFNLSLSFYFHLNLSLPYSLEDILTYFVRGIITVPTTDLLFYYLVWLFLYLFNVLSFSLPLRWPFLSLFLSPSFSISLSLIFPPFFFLSLSVCLLSFVCCLLVLSPSFSLLLFSSSVLFSSSFYWTLFLKYFLLSFWTREWH